MLIDKVRLIIFDLDGTLVDSRFDLADALNHTLITMGEKPLDIDHIKKLIGGGIKKLIETGFNGTLDEKTLNQALEIFNRYYSNNLTKKTQPYEGVKETLQNLAHLKKAVYSNKTHDFTVQIIKNLNLDSYFEWIQGADTTKYKLKPSPEGINYIISHFNITPDQVMMVGDSIHDIYSAKSAGILTCSVTYGYKKEDELAKESPNFIIHKMTDLIELIKH